MLKFLRSYTLIELMIVIAIALIVLMMGVGLVVAGWMLYSASICPC